jgi:predicted ribosome quality control (RQC) complex YloA/Tae2 family protein
MRRQQIQSIVEELQTNLAGRFLGKIFQLTPLSYALDFGYREGFLFISVEPVSPRLYLIKRRVKDLDKQSSQLNPFGQSLRAKLGGGQLVSVDQDALERVVRFSFRIEDALGATHFRRAVAQFTGRSANLFLLDELNRVTTALRHPKGEGQEIGDIYRPPVVSDRRDRSTEASQLTGESPSAVADAYYTALETKRVFDSLANSARARLRQSLQQKTRLKLNLESDLAAHGDPDEHKRMGDLLLANLATSVRSGNKVTLTDYYADDSPKIELEVDENSSLQAEAARRFQQYAKAKTAGAEIARRLKTVAAEIERLKHQQQELELGISNKDENALRAIAGVGPNKAGPKTSKSSQSQNIPGVRRYLSSDGYEVLVGRASRDNDHLTFRVARPHDLWMHAGDYPGSHVVIRNPTRKEIPQKTIIEAAQLAGRFSQASDDSKVVVHYTERKYLSKPKGAAPGLVRMSSFRSITVEPKESIRRI